MRVLLLWCLLTGACMGAGWPGHWVLAAVSFLAGMIAVWRPSHGADRDRRGGYLPPPTAACVFVFWLLVVVAFAAVTR